jgi:hypothetical protein
VIQQRALCDMIKGMEGNSLSHTSFLLQHGGGKVQILVCSKCRQKVVLKVYLICITVGEFERTNSSNIQTLSLLALPESEWCLQTL